MCRRRRSGSSPRSTSFGAAMAEWASRAREALAQGPTSLVTILATEGSAPRGSGARMVVTRSAFSGTIGGGALEHQAIQQARAILDLPPGSWRIQDYPLGPLLGQCCGGRVRLLVEHLAATGWIAALAAGAVVNAPLREGRIERRAPKDEHRWPRAALTARAAPLTSRGPLPG